MCVLILCVAAGAFSAFRTIRIDFSPDDPDAIVIAAGGVGVKWDREVIGSWLYRKGEPFVRIRPRVRFAWLPRVGSGSMFVPMWMIALPSLAGTLLARRIALSREVCARCGYSLTGLLPNTPCPECGHAQPNPSKPQT